MAVKRNAIYADIEALPDNVRCEILSPSTRRFDRVQKLAVYARERVQHVWLIDPDAQTLEIFRLENGRWSLLETFAGAARIRGPPFDEIELDLAMLWPQM